MIFVKQNDRRPAAPATIKRGSDVVDLSTATSVTFRMRERNRMEMKVEAVAVVTDAVNGEVEYRWAEGDTDTAGTFYADWRIVWSDSTTETFPTLDHDVVLIRPDLNPGA